MAAFTFSSVADVFPPATTVGAYPESNWPPHQRPPSGPAVGAATDTSPVASDGSLTFDGLADGASYYAGADVSGTWRYRRFTVSPASTGGGGGGGAVTVADGADVALGATSDAEATANGSVVALLKRLRTLLGGNLKVTNPDGSNIASLAGDTTPAENMANPTTAAKVASYGLLWDGTAWDRAPGTSANGVDVDVTRSNTDATAGSAPPAAGVYVVGTDGAAARGLLTDATGKLIISNPGAGSNSSVDAIGSTLPADATVVAGSDGTNTRAVRTDATGIVQAAVTNTPDVSIVNNPSVTATLAAGAASVGNVALDARTSGGASVSRVISAASTNATSAKASAGQVYGWYLSNANATTAAFLKLYNKASAPVVGTDVPVMTVRIPPGQSANVEFTIGVAFSLGIAFAITGAVADADATAVAANEVVVNLLYK